MCHKPNSLVAGFSLPATLFILVILAMLAAVIYRTVATGHSAVTLEMLSARTFLAAESGAQAAMMRLFPVSGAGACANISTSLSNTGFVNCTVTTTCTTIIAGTETVYPITSSARCIAGDLESSRSLEVMAKGVAP